MKREKILIWVDDERPVPRYRQEQYETIIICRTYKQATDILDRIAANKLVGDITIDLDHDIQCKQTGYDVAKYIVANDIPIHSFSCHSMNVVGKRNIIDLLLRYEYELVF